MVEIAFSSFESTYFRGRQLAHQNHFRRLHYITIVAFLKLAKFQGNLLCGPSDWLATINCGPFKLSAPMIMGTSNGPLNNGPRSEVGRPKILGWKNHVRKMKIVVFLSATVGSLIHAGFGWAGPFSELIN